MKILYIDDEADADSMTSRLEVMALEGIEAVAVTSVADALPRLRAGRNEFSCVVLDIIMPPLDTYSLESTNGGTTTGLALLQDIRKEFPAIPIVIISVMPPESASEHVNRFSVSAYIRKPADGTQIATILRRTLSKNDARP